MGDTLWCSVTNTNTLHTVKTEEKCTFQDKIIVLKIQVILKIQVGCFSSDQKFITRALKSPTLHIHLVIFYIQTDGKNKQLSVFNQDIKIIFDLFKVPQNKKIKTWLSQRIWCVVCEETVGKNYQRPALAQHFIKSKDYKMSYIRVSLSHWKHKSSTTKQFCDLLKSQRWNYMT